MNKKIVGFVLAICLTLGLGVVNVFADAYDGYGMAGQSYSEGEYTNHEAKSPTPVTDNVTNASAKSFMKGISQVFNYSSGFLLSVRDTTTNNITIFSGGVQKAVLKYNENESDPGNGTYAIASFNLSGSDYSVINSMGKDSFEENLKAFFKAMGVSETQLQETLGSIDTTEGGDLTEKQGDVKWFSRLAAHLAGGVNMSASIDFTAEGGASLTLSENGKVMSTINHAGVVVQSYVYNDSGFLEYIIQASPKQETEDTSSDDKDYSVKVNGKGYEYTKIYMDEFGRQSYSVKLDLNGKDNPTANDIKNASPVKNAQGETIIYSRNTYSANGSLVSAYDYSTKSTTYYANGRAAYVLNDKGAKTAEYFYHANGALNYVKSYNYDEDSGDLKDTSMIFYNLGNEIGTMSLTDIKKEDAYKNKSDEELADLARKAVNDVKVNGKDAQSISNSIYKAISNIKIYGADLRNNKFASFVEERVEGGALAVKNMKNLDNGSSAVGQLNLTQKEEAITDAEQGDSVYFSDREGGSGEDTTGEELYTKLVNRDVLKKGGRINFYMKGGKMVAEGTEGATKYIITEDGVYKNSVSAGNKLKLKCSGVDFANYIGSNMSASTFESKTGIKELNGDNYKNFDIFSTKTYSTDKYTEVTNISDSDKVAIENDHSYVKQQKTYKHGQTVGKKTSTTYSLTVFDRGAQAYTAEPNKNFKGDNVSTSKGVNIDPGYTGTWQGFETIDGEVYGVLEAATMDALDGGGIHAVDGEKILVKLSAKQIESLKNVEIGSKIGFAGFTGADVNGYATLTEVSKIITDEQEVMDIESGKKQIAAQDATATAMAKAMFGGPSKTAEEALLLRKAESTIAAMANGDYKTAEKGIKSLSKEDREKVLTGVLAGLNSLKEQGMNVSAALGGNNGMKQLASLINKYIDNKEKKNKMIEELVNLF